MRYALPRWTAPVLLLVFAGAARPVETPRFSMILERNGDSWHATCETGCTWNEVSARNKLFPSARVLIDNRGITAPATSADSTASFAFTVETDGQRGWQAKGLRGTSWASLGFTCGTATCRARVTETGVAGI